jgi:hypothetical protein
MQPAAASLDTAAGVLLSCSAAAAAQCCCKGLYCTAAELLHRTGRSMFCKNEGNDCRKTAQPSQIMMKFVLLMNRLQQDFLMKGQSTCQVLVLVEPWCRVLLAT